ncbi:HAD family hydrolase [Candidatus Woesearchaeota archaeon]|jgi:phosphoglycolate phosphatase|nr:HAD family hydrolase [Candidatus Woesearchaeota archaeon]MBT5272528.1 HAD family hydrolase [Candidatus Woesearchaeota archaeon]MBT6041464.1 HAD family hydrolase [Candidatus Woesearchaeota archaeon]MBT6336390.1 HAD family hydrolase [Candidatus Woesearchaeota archaeon]MBT7927711.1 HAD family hydrolase [Candidatus Woesearchaeota archaeon]
MIELVIFDWNGTLLADAQISINAGNHLVETFGGTPLPRKEYVEEFYFPAIDFCSDRGCDIEAMQGSEFPLVFHDFYEPIAAKCRTRRGARETLNWLQQESIDSIILTNHIQEKVMTQLNRLKLTSYFATVLGNTNYDDVAVGMNKIEKMKSYLSTTKINPAKAIIIGDSPEDIQIGKALDMITVAIKDGYTSTRRLRECNPNEIIGSLREFRSVVEKYR